MNRKIKLLLIPSPNDTNLEPKREAAK